MIFYDELCVIQDRTSKSPIGVGRLREGVYYFNNFLPSSVQVNVVRSHNLWHGRLGHPSHPILSMLSKELNSGRCVDGPCDACFRAKQTRTQFITSESHAKDIFDLIHCDIWGAYKVPSLCGAHYFLTIVDDASHAVWVYLMKVKGEASNLLQDFVVMATILYTTRDFTSNKLCRDSSTKWEG